MSSNDMRDSRFFRSTIWDSRCSLMSASIGCRAGSASGNVTEASGWLRFQRRNPPISNARIWRTSSGSAYAGSFRYRRLNSSIAAAWTEASSPISPSKGLPPENAQDSSILRQKLWIV